METIEDFGECPQCGTPLENMGAISFGDPEIYDDIICPQCGYEYLANETVY